MFYYFNGSLPFTDDLLQCQMDKEQKDLKEYLRKPCINFLRIQNLTDLFLFNYYQRLTFFGWKCSNVEGYHNRTL